MDEQRELERRVRSLYELTRGQESDRTVEREAELARAVLLRELRQARGGRREVGQPGTEPAAGASTWANARLRAARSQYL